MPEIGATLREARMRARIDVSELEAETKIRAKYLRALENEEWELLPGPTYVKSFLRTYAEALDLDAKLLVDEYKLRHERLNEVELQPINAAAPGRVRRRRTGPIVPRSVVVGLIFALLLLALYTLGQQSNDNPSSSATSTQTTPPTGSAATTTTTTTTPKTAPPRPRPARVGLRIVATGQVYVCLEDPSRTLVNGRTLQAGERTATYRSRRFALTLGNANARLIVNGHQRRVPASSTAIGLEITQRHGRRPLSEKARPSCK
jgi:cytoskeleton protein RodZ